MKTDDNIIKLTVKEALEQGYTKCGYANESWQSVLDISELTELDFNRIHRSHLVLFSKDEYHPSISAEQIKDLIADTVSDTHGQDTGDDTDNVYDTLQAIELSQFESLVNHINEKLSEHVYWKGTDIQLIPNPLQSGN